MDHFKLVRDIWPLLREHLVDPLEILPDIQGFTDVDREDIKAAALRSKIQAIDKLQEALRRRNFRCFQSFLYALLKHKYVDLAMEIAERGGIQLEYPPRLTGAMQQNITSPITGKRNVQVYRGTAQICCPKTLESRKKPAENKQTAKAVCYLSRYSYSTVYIAFPL